MLINVSSDSSTFYFFQLHLLFTSGFLITIYLTNLYAVDGQSVCVGQNLLCYDYTYACIFFLEIPIQCVWKMVQYYRQCFVLQNICSQIFQADLKFFKCGTPPLIFYGICFILLEVMSHPLHPFANLMKDMNAM